MSSNFATWLLTQGINVIPMIDGNGFIKFKADISYDLYKTLVFKYENDAVIQHFLACQGEINRMEREYKNKITGKKQEKYKK